MEEKNKYQEALDNAVHDIDYKYYDFGVDVPEERLAEIKLLKELVDKETPMPVDKKTITVFVGNNLYDESWEGYCLRCNSIVKRNFYEGEFNYCPYCGQRLNWQQDENEKEE